MERPTERLGWWWEEERPDHPNLELGRLEGAGASLVRRTAWRCTHIVGIMERVGSRRAGRAALENHMACHLEAEGMGMDMDVGIGFGVVGIGPSGEEGLMWVLQVRMSRKPT